MPNKPHLLRIEIQKLDPMNVFIWHWWGKNISFLELRDDKDYSVNESFVVCLLSINITVQSCTGGTTLNLRPLDDWLFIFSWMFGLKPSQFLFRARNLTENFPAWSTRLSERWEGWGRGRLNVQDTWECSVSVRRCHWRMLAFNILPSSILPRSGQDMIFCSPHQGWVRQPPSSVQETLCVLK